MLHLLPNLKGCEGKHTTVSQTLPASTSLFWPLLIPSQLVEDTQSLTHCLLLCLDLCNGFPTLCLLIPVPLLWDLSRTNVCSSGIPVPWPSLTRLPPIFGAVSPAVSCPILFSASSTLLPLKIYGIFCLLLSTICLWIFFIPHGPRPFQIFWISHQTLAP